MGTNENGRNCMISARLSDEEKETLKQKASEAHMSQAMFIRNSLEHGGAYKRMYFSQEYRKKILHEIDSIGNNLNRIKSHVCYNKDNDVDVEEYLKQHEKAITLLSQFYDYVGRSPDDDK